MQAFETGDVIEFQTAEGARSALVLLANGGAAIIDFCDGSTPLSVLVDELPGLRVFSGDEFDDLDARIA
jgi:hypothetical protein